MTSPTVDVIHSSFTPLFIHSVNECLLGFRFSANPRAWSRAVGEGLGDNMETAAGVEGWQMGSSRTVAPCRMLLC